MRGRHSSWYSRSTSWRKWVEDSFYSLVSVYYAIAPWDTQNFVSDRRLAASWRWLSYENSQKDLSVSPWTMNDWVQRMLQHARIQVIYPHWELSPFLPQKVMLLEVWVANYYENSIQDENERNASVLKSIGRTHTKCKESSWTQSFQIPNVCVGSQL